MNLREVQDAQSEDELRHIWWRNKVWFRTRGMALIRREFRMRRERRAARSA